jgi:transcriptional regulator with XRE-family HTH domain
MRKLETVVDLLEAMREERGWASDNQIARGLRVGQQTVSSWRTGVRTPGDDHALKIAEALDISPALVMAIAAMERSTSKESRKIWRILAEQLARGVVPTVAALAVLAASYTEAVHGVCILRKKGRRSLQAAEASV